MKTIVIKMGPLGSFSLGRPTVKAGWQPGGKVAHYHLVEIPDDVGADAVLNRIRGVVFLPFTPSPDAAPEDFVISWQRLQDAAPGGVLRTQPRKDESRLDTIQERCIERMRELGLVPRNVWERLGETEESRNARCGYNHVNEFLSRRSSMSSHKLQHVFEALDLSVTAH